MALLLNKLLQSWKQQACIATNAITTICKPDSYGYSHGYNCPVDFRGGIL